LNNMNTEKGERLNKAQSLQKKLSFRHIWALGVGAVVGDGIFLLMGEGTKIAGPAVLLAYGLAGMLMLFIMVSMGEMAMGMPEAGAMWVWNRRMLGGLWGFLTGSLYSAGWIIAGGSVGIAIGTLSTRFLDIGLPQDISIVVWGVVLVSLFAVINLCGVTMAANTQLIMVLGLIGMMLIFSITGIASSKIELSNFSPFLPKGYGSLFPAIALGTYAYMGGLTLTTAGGEVKNAKDLPRGLVWASLTVIIIYSLAMFVMLGLISWKNLSVIESPFVSAAQVAFGSSAAIIINAGAWLAAATCLLGGTLYSAPRLLFSMGEKGVLPHVFSQLSKKSKTPGFSTIAVWLISLCLIVLGWQQPDIIYVYLSMLLVFCWSLTWLITLLSAIAYRKKYPDEIESLKWKQPAFPLFPVLGLAGVAIIMYGTFQAALISLLVGLAFLGLLIMYYFLYGKKNMESQESHHDKNS
jgi:L-asparagine transporter-like permease